MRLPIAKSMVLLALAACSAFALAGKDTPAYKNPKLPIEVRVEDLLKRMTLEEKLNQVRSGYGEDVWLKPARTTGFGEVYDILRPLTARAAALRLNEVQKNTLNSRLGIPILMRDEALHGLICNGATSFPQSMGMAATWNPLLVGQGAKAIAREAKVRGVNRVLSPVINIARDARWGRVEETYGEDPFLCSRLTAAYVKAMETNGVATTPKHFVANIGDGGRDSHSIHMTEQFLREIYLAPFEAAVKEGGARSIMTAYNSLNGVACSANHWLLNDLLKKEWGFKGVVGSDYGAANGTRDMHHNVNDYVECAAADMNAGLDIEWPNIYVYGKPLEDAIKRGLVSQKTLDEAVRRMLRNKFELGLFENRFADPDLAEKVVQCKEHRDIALQAARESLVLLKNNNNALPLKKSINRIAVLGSTAANGMPLGGYSGYGQKTVSVLDGIRALVPGVEVVYAKGSSFGEGGGALPVIPATAFGGTSLKGEYFNNQNWEGQPVYTQLDQQINFDWVDSAPDRLPTDHFSIRWTGMLTAPKTGTYKISVTSDDGFKLFIDGKKVSSFDGERAAGTTLAEVNLVEGKPVAFRLDYFDVTGQASVKLGWSMGEVKDTEVDEAVALAKTCDAAIIVAGVNEGEGGDRSHLDLPGTQEELIKSVSATGVPTTVVLVAGSPVTMQAWVDKPDAILDAWYPGQEGGTAIAEALFGDYNPGGKLPMTFPMYVGQCPTYYNMDPTGRGWDYNDLTGKPQFAFGYGLSYTNFKYSGLKITPGKGSPKGVYTVTAEVENTGSVAGDEVVQLYIHDLVASMVRPIKELKGFERIHLNPGEKKTVTFKLGFKELSFYDAKVKLVVEPGDFDIMVGSASDDIRLSGKLTVVK